MRDAAITESTDHNLPIFKLSSRQAACHVGNHCPSEMRKQFSVKNINKTKCNLSFRPFSLSVSVSSSSWYWFLFGRTASTGLAENIDYRDVSWSLFAGVDFVRIDCNRGRGMSQGIIPKKRNIFHSFHFLSANSWALDCQRRLTNERLIRNPIRKELTLWRRQLLA